MFKNMKFEVNGNLDEIVAELEKRGYVLDRTHGKNFVFTHEDGTIDCFDSGCNDCDWFELTTLAELKEM